MTGIRARLSSACFWYVVLKNYVCFGLYFCVSFILCAVIFSAYKSVNYVFNEDPQDDSELQNENTNSPDDLNLNEKNDRLLGAEYTNKNEAQFESVEMNDFNTKRWTSKIKTRIWT